MFWIDNQVGYLIKFGALLIGYSNQFQIMFTVATSYKIVAGPKYFVTNGLLKPLPDF